MNTSNLAYKLYKEEVVLLTRLAKLNIITNLNIKPTKTTYQFKSETRVIKPNNNLKIKLKRKVD